MAKIGDAREDENMWAIIKKKNVDIREIKKQYTSGMGIDKIAMIQRLSDEEIDMSKISYLHITKEENTSSDDITTGENIIKNNEYGGYKLGYAICVSLIYSAVLAGVISCSHKKKNSN